MVQTMANLTGALPKEEPCTSSFEIATQPKKEKQ